MDRGQIEDIYPLSPMQQGMLFHSLYAPHSGVYVEQLCLTLSGDLNLQAFTAAWQRVVDRHTALRTAVVWEDLDEPVQVVCRQVNLPIEQQDWRAWSVDEQRAQLELYLDADQLRGFDLSTPPLMRVALLRLAPSTYQLVWSHHHLLLDGWSMILLLDELFAVYQALLSRQPLRLSAVRPYRDFIAWLKEQDPARARDHWRAKLKGFTSPTSLRLPVPRSRSSATRYAEQQLSLSTALTQDLLSLIRRHHLTLNTVVQGAWAVLLSRYSGQADVLYGVTVAGRPAELVGVEQMVGLFINTLPMRVSLTPQQSMLQLLMQLQRDQVEMRQYEYISLLDVQGCSQIERGQALFESIVIFENYPMPRNVARHDTATDSDAESAASLSLAGVRYNTRTNYPLTLMATPGKKMVLHLVYDSWRYEEAVIRRMLQQMERVLAAMVADPSKPIATLPLLPPSERQHLLALSTQTTHSFPSSSSLHQMFRRQAERTPTTIALTDQHQHLSYQQLNSRANRLAHYLQGLGVGPESIVGILLSRTVEMVVSVLGVLKAGGAYLPLEAEAPTGRLHWMLGDTGAEVVITDSEHKGMVSGWGVEVVDVGEQRQEIGAYSGEEVESKAGADNLAYVIYTSGSTGRPKAVMVTHRSVVNLLSCMQELTGLDAQGKVLAVTPLSFDIAGLELWLPLMSGAQVEIISRELAVDGERLGQLLRERDVTLMQATPSTWRMILESGWQGAPQLHVLCGGESLSAELAAELRNRCGRLWNLYGPTETTIWSSAQELQGTETHVTIGRPLWNTQMYVLTRDLELLPEAVTGEMYIAGAGVARGYLHRPELTAERFMPDPYAKERGARMYRTGDLGRYIGGGEIEYLGRRDEQVKVRGYRIELGEIEEVIREQEWVREAVVVVREGEDGEKRLVAHVVVREGDEGQEQELRRRVSERLPWYMRPEMRMRERLPLSVNGKVDRRRLAEEGEEGEGGSKREREKARSEVEEVLVGIWEEVLGEEEVGIEDDFFELGGHSLRAMQLVSRVRRAFEIELPLEKVFTSSTIAQLAPVIVQVQAQQIDGAEVDRMLAELEGLPSDQMD